MASTLRLLTHPQLIPSSIGALLALQKGLMFIRGGYFYVCNKDILSVLTENITRLRLTDIQSVIKLEDNIILDWVKYQVVYVTYSHYIDNSKQSVRKNLLSARA